MRLPETGPTVTYSLYWWTLRTVRTATEDGNAFQARHMVVMPTPDQPSRHLLDLGGRKQNLYLEISLYGATLQLDRLDPLLESTWTRGSVFVDEDGQTNLNPHTFTRADLEVDRITVPGLGFSQDLRPADQRPSIVKYLITMEFALPELAMPSPMPTHPAASANDIVFLFPFEPNRIPKRLWANMSLLSKRSTYFEMLFRSPLCASHNNTANQFKSFSDITGDHRVSNNPCHLSSYDSDTDGNQNPAGRFRKPRWMNIASASGGATRHVRYVVVKHHCHRTYRAILHYIESNHGPDAACLKSARTISSRGRVEEGHLSASPKSVYRLAHQLMLEPAKIRALADYKRQIRPENFVDELFSEYTVLYPELREVVLEAIKETENGTTAGSAIPIEDDGIS